jgi:hypothetical protein
MPALLNTWASYNIEINIIQMAVIVGICNMAVIIVIRPHFALKFYLSTCVQKEMN